MEAPQYKSRAGVRLGVTAVLVLLVIILAVAATLSTVHNLSADKKETQFHQRELADKMQSFIAAHEDSPPEQRVRRSKPAAYIGCVSEATNNSIPVAHIVGYHNWKTTYSSDDNTRQTGYQTTWECMDYNNGQPFVDGGMCFDLTLNQLIVPTCGYYYVSSMITFQITDDENREAFHKMVTNHSCPSDPKLQAATVMGHTTVGQGGNEATSYVDQVVMLCSGGNIQVNIPDTAACCGEGKFSYINAFLVKETDCIWHRPVTIY